MRRWLCRATFCLIVLSLPLWGQRHGGGGAGGGAHFASHGVSSGHSAGSFHGGSFHAGNAGRGSGVRIRTSNSYYGYRGFYGRGAYYPYAYYPYLGYGWDWDSYDDQNQTQDAYADSYSPPPPDNEDSGLRSDVQALNGKIDRLQADVEARNRAKPEQEPETALVFRDQHVEEVRNYAISGGTLWVLNNAAAKKIPLVNLDIEATVKMNEDRGVDFQVPEPALQIMIVR